MTTVSELIPGDLVASGGYTPIEAVFIARTRHPIWPTLDLVIWKLANGTWSLDALHSRQDVGTVAAVGGGERQARLRRALLGGERL